MTFVKVEYGWVVFVELVGRRPGVIALIVSFPSHSKVNGPFALVPSESSIDDMIDLVLAFFEPTVGSLCLLLSRRVWG